MGNTFNDYRDYLAHHGIKGMKWGIRRYQNEDGSLTSQGENRYRKGNRVYSNGGWHNIKGRMGHRNRSISATREHRLANGKRLSDKGETVESRLVKRTATGLIANPLKVWAAGAGITALSAGAAMLAAHSSDSASSFESSMNTIAAGGSIASSLLMGYGTYLTVDNLVGAYQDVSDINEYKRSKSKR